MQEAAAELDSAHAKVKSTRSQLKRCRKMYLNAEVANQEAETEFSKAKDSLEQKLTEKS